MTSAMISYVAVGLTLLIGLSILLSIAVTRVPTLSSSKLEVSAVIALLKGAQLPERAVIIDLGSGWGTLIIALSKAFPDASVQGVEVSPFPYLVSRIRTYRLRNVSLRLGSLFRDDITTADAITCYLMPGVMASVGDFLDKTAKPGTRVVSNTFLFRERAASATHQGSWGGTVALYVWPARPWVA